MRKLTVLLALTLAIILAISFFLLRGFEKVKERRATDLNFCGDGVCSKSENKFNCCIDCGCDEDEYCNTNNMRCYPHIHGLTKDRVASILIPYLKRYNISYTNITWFGITKVKGKMARLVLVANGKYARLYAVFANGNIMRLVG